MTEQTEIKSRCVMCNNQCAVAATMQDGEIIDIRGDRDNKESKGFFCKRGRASMEFIYNRDRLLHPLKRVGEKGEGKWQRISWDEALDTVAASFKKIKKEDGPNAVLMVHGNAKGLIDTQLVRLANAFGTSNVVCSDHVCAVPKRLAAEYTMGFAPESELNYPPALIISWGAGRSVTGTNLLQKQMDAVSKGTKLIVIDPVKIPPANKADLWLKIRPGTDLALALGMINIIINEKLYDADFVEKWTVGFKELKDHVQLYPPEKVAEITWIPEDMIIKAARMYAANKPSYIDYGNALEQTINSFQAPRAIAILMAITGNIGIPGGEIEGVDCGFRFTDIKPVDQVHGRWSSEFELRDNISREQRKHKIGAGSSLLEDFRYDTPQSVIKSVLSGEPYPIKAVFVQGSNPLSSWCNLKETFKAFKQLEFLVVSDFVMTPTAALADIIFPPASYYEYDHVNVNIEGTSAVFQKQLFPVQGECKSDHEIIMNLARKLGLERYFWNSMDEFWDYVLRPVAISYEELKNTGRYATSMRQPRQYKKYEKEGFKTPSGKVELYSKQLESWGIDPLPVYHEAPETPFSAPDLCQEYPFQCTTRKPEFYRHSDCRGIPSLREAYPDPVVIINRESAEKLGISDGDWVCIESKRGVIKQKSKLSEDIDRRVVVVDHAWWFPEKGIEQLFGWADSNCNVLTGSDVFNRELGSFTARGFAVKIYKAN
jgi:anaerobic selenocysteine-containing dehydrogenase